MHVRLVFGGGLAWCVKYILTCCNLPKVDLQLCRSESRLVCKYSLPCCYLPKVDLQLCRSDSRLVCTSTAHHAATYQRLFRSDNSLVCTVRHAATYQRLTSSCSGQTAASFEQSPDGRGHCTTSSTCRQWVGNCLQCALGSEEMIF